jgi:16S rRNA (uracil1498-N3)-methyltransferase
MKIHRFFADLSYKTNEITISDKELVHQMNNVLKLQPGELVELFDGSGEAFLGEITDLSKKSVGLEKKEYKTVSDERKEVFAYIPLLRRSNTELMVQKLTELGIKNIIPIKSDRSVKTDVNLDRLKKISIEATEQSGQYFLANIKEPVKLADALLQSKNTTQVVFDMEGENISEISKEFPLSFFVGPEGGWTDDERGLFKTFDVTVAALGQTTLRGETATIAAAYESLRQK